MTYESGGRRNQIHFLVRKADRRLVRNVKAIVSEDSEECVLHLQHRLVLEDLTLLLL